MPEKVVLAYSGGLDTSIIIPWLKENYSYEVIAMVGDVGQGDDIEAVVNKAYKTGASKVVVEELREEFLTEYVFRALQAGAVYEHKYLLGTSLARPVIAKHQVEVALREGATALAHGCTGKGNDQVRFELAYQALAPELAIIAPWREWSIVSREDAIDVAAARSIPIPVPKKDPYSRDRNLWQLSHDGGPLGDPAFESITLDLASAHEKERLSTKYAELVYNGQWFAPLKEALDAFVNKLTESVTGTVTLKLYKGNATVIGRKSPYSLYQQDLASFDMTGYDVTDSAGFIKLFGLPLP